MVIKSAEFVTSSTVLSKCPPPDKPEFAFIGRSNVGKSSLINMLMGRKNLAKTSVKPGKTQTINHFIINGNTYFVDLPGYGYAGVSKATKEGWPTMIENFLLHRETLLTTFVLIDVRLDPQPIDQDFIGWMGKKNLPFSMVFTKSDKISRTAVNNSIGIWKRKLQTTWEELPPMFLTSAEKKTGKEELGEYMDAVLKKTK